MNKKEKKLADLVIGCFPDKTSINRIESHSTSIGFPDIEYYNRSARGVIELKVIDSITSKIPLRDTQIGWLYRRIDSGDRPLIIIETSDTRDIYIVQFKFELQTGLRDNKSLLDIIDEGLSYHKINGKGVALPIPASISDKQSLLWIVLKELQKNRKTARRGYERKG